MSAAPRLETERLILRGHEVQDFAALYALWTDPTASQYVTQPHSEEDGWKKLLIKAGCWELLGFGYWMVEEKATGKLLGEVGFHDMRRDITPSLGGTMEAGWTFAGHAQGKGHAREAVRAMLDWCDETHREALVTCIIDPENTRSITLAQSFGFREIARTSYKQKPVIMYQLARGTHAG